MTLSSASTKYSKKMITLILDSSSPYSPTKTKALSTNSSRITQTKFSILNKAPKAYRC